MKNEECYLLLIGEISPGTFRNAIFTWGFSSAILFSADKKKRQ